MEDDGFHWVFSGVYDPTEKRLREAFWEELGSIRGLWENPWCVGGDFNEILSPNERSRGGRISNTMRRFSEVLNDLGLRDLPTFLFKEGITLGRVAPTEDQCPV